MSNTPPVPDFLYKYLSPDRIQNVLGENTIRFSPLISTNDIFEVRLTCKKIWGDKMTSIMSEAKAEMFTDEYLQKAIDKELENYNIALPEDVKRELYKVQKEFIKNSAEKLLLQAQEKFNNPEEGYNFLKRMMSEYGCLSLSEKWDSSVMWAHYADYHKGFVIAFNSGQSFFHQKGDEKRVLWKVTYTDEMVDELLNEENLKKGLISKTSEWAYEREWRIYDKLEQMDKIIDSFEELIHLNYSRICEK